MRLYLYAVNLAINLLYIQLIVFIVIITFMNTRDLEYIIAVADLKNFSKAADACYVSQPALSNQIKKLEDFLQIKIFERTNKKVLITDSGALVIEQARKILQEVEHLKELVNVANDPLSGRLKLGAFPTLAPYFWPYFIPHIRQELSKIDLILVEEKTSILLDRLKSGILDAALIALPVDDPELEAIPLFDDVFYLAVAKDHPLASLNEVDQQDLKKHKILLLEEGHCLRDQALDICYTNGGIEQQEFKATSLETLRQMIKLGSFVTLIPEIAVKKEDTDIVYIPFKAPIPRRSIALVYRKATARGEIMRAMADLIATKVFK